MTQDNDDLLQFVDEPDQPLHTEQPWRVLIVDDEPDVHAATSLALRGLAIEGRDCVFSHAYSGAEALAILQHDRQFAVALIDVVMESEDAGLQLVKAIREQLLIRDMRIILRTGQPGYAPEIDTIRQHDINDYKTKSELTRIRLFTSVSMAVRSFAQLQQLEVNRLGLEQILAATAELGKPEGLNKFASGLVTQLCALLKVDDECLVCAVLEHGQQEPQVLAAAGRFHAWIGQPLRAIEQAGVRDQLLLSLTDHQHHFEQGACLYVAGKGEQGLAAYIGLDRALSEVEHNLLQVFCSNISVAFDNLQLYLRINDLAYQDSLVNLPNRNGLLLSLSDQTQADHCLALIDLDGFSDINSILDDSFGDQVLQAAAERLRSHFSLQCCVARIGSDIFALHGPSSEVNPERIQAVFSTPLDSIEQETLRISATTGILKLNGAPQSPAELLKDAGAALKEAKHFRRGKVHWHQAGSANAARERMRLLSRLRIAFSSERLQLHYQPFVDLTTGRIIGAEALLRWRTEEGVNIPPDHFIPLAEHSGLMVALGEWVLRTALTWRASLVGVVGDDFRVAINVSQVQFAEPNFVALVIQAIADAGLTGQHVEIELTESMAMEHLDLLKEKLILLSNAGISLAIDDFGTGYSSLSILQHLTLTRLKIDRSFVSGDPSERKPMGIAKTVIALAQHLDLHTIAEGIETPAQQQQLLAAGCKEGQGYWFSPPVDSDRFLQLLTQPALGQP